MPFLIPLDFDPTAPFRNLRPDFGPFNGLLGNWAGILLALVWACCFVVLAFRLIVAIVRAVKARNRHQADGMEEAAGEVLFPLAGIILLAAAPIIWSIAYSGQAPH